VLYRLHFWMDFAEALDPESRLSWPSCWKNLFITVLTMWCVSQQSVLNCDDRVSYAGVINTSRRPQAGLKYWVMIVLKTLLQTVIINCHMTYETFQTSVSETIRKPPLVKAQTEFLKNKNKIKYGENDFQYGRWNSYTLQCGMWLWDIVSQQSTCHSAPVLSKSDNRGQKKWCHVDFKMADLGHLGF